MNKLVDYSDSEPDKPVIKRKKRCQVKKEDWSSEVNTKNREKGKEYCDYCASKHKKALFIATFTNTLTIQKIALFKPKKDLCDICNEYKLGHITKETYDDHVNKKNEARMEKESAKEKKEFVFSEDLQAVLLASRSNVSSNYYKTKLCVHNWCIYDMKTSDGYCFLWNEAEAEYITICKKAKKSKPYIVEYLNYSYFKNFKNLQFYNSIRPGKMKGDPKVTDIRAFKYAPSREIFYKLKLTKEYKLLNQRRNARINNIPFHNLPDLYNERRKITKKIYLDLQQLKNSMPRDYQNYYGNLPHEA
ncbi:unnamed protein product [Pieris macdunnoughi]|uniref:Uncharacterized protein n=1 Tax=Pieris macdunnoughi TaxID=345717 RepID=A0A821VND0_9NEOP|nr:unnamed protein product [Pieris macdunnoughi]